MTTEYRMQKRMEDGEVVLVYNPGLDREQSLRAVKNLNAKCKSFYWVEARVHMNASVHDPGYWGEWYAYTNKQPKEEKPVSIYDTTKEYRVVRDHSWESDTEVIVGNFDTEDAAQCWVDTRANSVLANEAYHYRVQERDANTWRDTPQPPPLPETIVMYSSVDYITGAYMPWRHAFAAIDCGLPTSIRKTVRLVPE